MKLSHGFKLIICLLSFNALHAFKIKNTLKYPIEYRRVSEPTPSGEASIHKDRIMIKSGATSENILTSAGNAPIFIPLNAIASQSYQVILKDIAPTMSKEELASADTIFDAIEGTALSLGFNSQGKRGTREVVTLAPQTAPAPTAPPAPRPENRPLAEHKEQKEGKSSDAAAQGTSSTAAAAEEPRVTAGNTPQD